MIKIHSWLKKACRFAEQQYFDFYNPSEYKPAKSPLETEEQKFWNFVKEEADPQEVGAENALEDVLFKFPQYKNAFLKAYSSIYQPDVVTFPTGEKVETVDINGTLSVIDGRGITEAREWVNGLHDFDLITYIPEKDFNQEFWEDIGKGSVVYHATPNENVQSIMEQGLLPQNQTRGISNRGMGEAVFTGSNPDALDAYGDTIIEIDLGKMKASGYMPRVSGEEPLEEAEMRNAIAWELGIEDYYADEGYASEGLHEDTVAFYGAIPPVFLKVAQQ